MTRGLLIGAFAVAAVALTWAEQAPPLQAAQQVPEFKSSVIVVPIDVRVVDNRTGKAVTDLKAEDFTLFEDGVAQPIRLFEQHRFTAETPAPDARPAIRESAFGAPEQRNRIFLIVLGRGKHNLTTSRPLEALQDFVRKQLLPQDQVAVFAYDRATDFTTDHEAIAQLVGHFAKVHYGIDMDVALQLQSGLAALYGSRGLPKSVQRKIDDLFQSVPGLAAARVGGGGAAVPERTLADSARAAGDLQRADVNQKSIDMAAQMKKDLGADMPGGGLGGWSSLDEVTANMFTGLTLDEFMENNAQSLQDLGNCYAGIEYLRHLEGEKHLIFVTQGVFNLPRGEDDTDLAAAANDARVAIHTFQTGGIIGQQGGAVQTSQNMAEAFSFKALRTIAELSGGTSSIAEQGAVAVDRINDMTQHDYVLGYYPSMARLDGSYRKIEVKVKRPDSTVLYRHGYFARREVGSFNRRDFITRQRIQAAATFSRELRDSRESPAIRLKLKASLERVPGGAHQLVINLGIDPARLALSVQDGRRVGAIDILIAGADERGEIMGQHYQHANVDLAEDVYQKALKGDGIPYSARIQTNPGVRNVRAIVYDYKADVVGRADARVF